MITKKLTVEELKEFWKLHIAFIPDGVFPEDIEFNEIIRYSDRDDYINILRLYDINNLLILLSFFELWSNFETCGEIKFQIENYNKQFNTTFKTHL